MSGMHRSLWRYRSVENYSWERKNNIADANKNEMETRGSFQFAYFDAIKKISNNNNVIKNSMSKQNKHFSRIPRNGHWCGGWRTLLFEFMVIVVLGTFLFYCRERNQHNAWAINSTRAARTAIFFGPHRARVTRARNDTKNKDESWKNVYLGTSTLFTEKIDCQANR